MSKIQSALQMLKSDRSTLMAAIIQIFLDGFQIRLTCSFSTVFKMGHKLDLNHPKTFTEKIQWKAL